MVELLILAVSARVVLLSVEWMDGEPREGEYYSLLLMSALGAVVLAGAADLMELVLGVLLSSATGYVLAAYTGPRPAVARPASSTTCGPSARRTRSASSAS